MNMKVKIAGVEFKNPVPLAQGQNTANLWI